MITQARLKEVATYNPTTGVFTKGDKSWGCLDKSNGYTVMRIDGKKYAAHRLAWLYMTGKLPSSKIDHKDRVRSNNIWDNLRLISDVNNSRNISMKSTNKSGLNGVSWCKKREMWRVTTTVEGKHTYLGYYESKSAAFIKRLSSDFRHGFTVGNPVGRELKEVL